MKAVEEGSTSVEYAGGGVDRRRLLAKRCIVLTEENRVRKGR